MLMPEADEQARDLFFELLVPQPGGYFLDPLDADDVTTLGVPAGYVLNEDDRALARPGAEFASRIGLTPVPVPGGHESMLTRPDEVANALLTSTFPVNMRFAAPAPQMKIAAVVADERPARVPASGSGS